MSGYVRANMSHVRLLVVLLSSCINLDHTAVAFSFSIEESYYCGSPEEFVSFPSMLCYYINLIYGHILIMSSSGVILDVHDVMSQRAFKKAMILHRESARLREPYFLFNITLDTIDTTDNFQVASTSKCHVICCTLSVSDGYVRYVREELCHPQSQLRLAL